MSTSSLELALCWRPATVADADALLAIEQRAYSHPWTRGNFIDSLAGGHWAWCATRGDSTICAYWLAMQVLDEVHLLNLAVAPEHWGQGLGQTALQHLHQTAGAQGLQDIWLEVRESNQRAQRLYQAAGYQTVGRRRAYYPADAGREDALLMRRGEQAHEPLDDRTTRAAGRPGRGLASSTRWSGCAGGSQGCRCRAGTDASVCTWAGERCTAHASRGQGFDTTVGSCARPLPSVVQTSGLADLDAVAAAVRSCQACGLCRTRKQAVPGLGHPQAEWMVVGEGPGEQEDEQGEPFVGRSGQLLDEMLGTLGLSRGPGTREQQVFIANTVKCRPPGNRNPSAEELAACAPYLQRQLALVRPRVVLALGRFAAQALLATEAPVGSLRGRVHRLADGTPVVVSYHPAYLLRQPLEKARAWDDLCLAASRLQDEGAAP